MKKVLVLGENSYIGKNVYNWLLQDKKKYKINILSTRNREWQHVDWNNVDVVIDCAGIAHINNITENMRELFYSVNRDLTIEIASYAKKHGVQQFILFSSMNVYGDYCEHVTDRNASNPTSFYGDSKLQGDIGVKKMEDESFKIALVRPPFVYGKGCSGNYNIISKLAEVIPIFPTYKNRKSMIYIDNLCEFIRLLLESGEGGVYTPQNVELVSTADLVKEISKAKGHNVHFTGLFNWIIPFGNKLTRKIRRGFADDCYDLSLSDYWDWKYNIVSFTDSIKRTEGR